MRPLAVFSTVEKRTALNEDMFTNSSVYSAIRYGLRGSEDRTHRSCTEHVCSTCTKTSVTMSILLVWLVLVSADYDDDDDDDDDDNDDVIERLSERSAFRCHGVGQEL